MVMCAHRLCSAVWLLVWLFVGLQVVSTLAHEDSEAPEPVEKPKLIAILLDAFRWDYVDREREDHPGFSRFLKEGVRAAWLNPPFPSLSFPSWTSLVTGQHPETHQIVNNFMYDSEDEELFGLSEHTVSGKKKWWPSEPLWVTATLEGLRVAVFRWSRCDVEFNGTHPEVCLPFSGGESFRELLDFALDKLSEGFDLTMVYYAGTDDEGHGRGPDSDELKEMVNKIDAEFVYLQDKLEEMGLTNKTNIVVASDHGMTNAKSENLTIIDIDDYMDSSLIENICGSEAYFNIKVPKENVDKVYEQLKKIEEGVDVFLREEIPDDLHIKKGKYITEITVVVHPGVVLLGTKDRSKQLSARGGSDTGIHGYTPDMKDMKGIFFAKGPDFVKNKMIPAIDNVDVYQVMANVLRIEPRPHNGTWEHVTKLFQEQRAVDPMPEGGSSFPLTVVLLVVAGVVLVGLAWRYQLKERFMAAMGSYSRAI